MFIIIKLINWNTSTRVGTAIIINITLTIKWILSFKKWIAYRLVITELSICPSFSTTLTNSSK